MEVEKWWSWLGMGVCVCVVFHALQASCSLPTRSYQIPATFLNRRVSPELKLQQALKRASTPTRHAPEPQIGTRLFEQPDKARDVPFARVVHRQHKCVFSPVPVYFSRFPVD